MWTISLLSVRKMGRVREDADTSENRCSTSQSELDGTRVAKLFSRMLVETRSCKQGSVAWRTFVQLEHALIVMG